MEIFIIDGQKYDRLALVELANAMGIMVSDLALSADEVIDVPECDDDDFDDFESTIPESAFLLEEIESAAFDSPFDNFDYDGNLPF